jgi:hypothetical protein
MSSQDAKQIELDFLPESPVVVQQHEGQMTSDGGLLLVAQFDRRLNYTARMAACLQPPTSVDSPAAQCLSRAQHQPLEMLRQRIFGILGGYEDCNDHDTLRNDPVFKVVADRLPEGDALASQPTLSRFENSVTAADLQRLIDFNIATGIERLKAANGGTLPASITLDLDATDDPTHGHQQLTLFHGYYKQYQTSTRSVEHIFR